MTYLVSPFNALNQINRELNRFFDDRPAGAFATDSAAWTPQVDISQTPEAFQVMVDVPGVRSEDIEVSLHNGVLTIRGERKSDAEIKDQTFARRERFAGTFVRQFNLPESADPETVSAKSVNGVLEITIPKARKAKPVAITVEGE